MMMKRLIFLLLFSQTLIIQAQSIKGVIFSAQEKAPVEFSPVTLLHLPDSAMVSGTSTKAGGLFMFGNVKPGKYYVKATYLGSAPGGRSVVVDNNSGVIQLDTIFMIPSSQQLAEVKVTGERIKGTELVDRTVYSIPAEIAKTSINGYEVLRKIPGIQVDFNNNVTLNGKSNFIIQVDGKQRDQQYLARLQPTDIKSIEVINNPSGKYEGTIDGVINIILTKEARVGMNGNFSTMLRASDKPTGFGAGSLEYGFGKLTIYASGYSFFQQLKNNVTNYSRYLYNDSIANLSGSGNFKIAASAINTGFDYYINDKNNLSFNFSFKPVVLDNNIQNSGQLMPQEVYKYYFSSPSTTGTRSNETNYSLYYKKTFAKPIKELSAEATYYTFSSKDNNSFTYLYYADDQTTLRGSSKRDENNTNDRNYFSGKVDFVEPLGFSTRIETGYQLYYQGMNYDFSGSDIASNNLFKYSEWRNSAYAGFVWNAGKFGFQGTVRGEYSSIQVNKGKTSDYLATLPSTNIQYKISSKQNVKFTYNRRINRPGVYDLNPFLKLNNNLNFSQGNPDLEPEYRNRLQLTYTLNLGSNFISPNLYYEMISNKIGNKNSLILSPGSTDTALLASPANILTGYERGIGLNAMLFFFNINARVYQGHYDRYNYIDNSNKLNTIDGQNYSSYSITSYAFKSLFKKKVNAYVFLSYNGVNVNAQSKTYSTPMYGFGAQKIAGNHTFGFFYFLPFKKNFEMSRTITETPFVYSKNVSSFDVSYYIQVMYSYKFNKGKAVKKLNRKVEVESDTKSGGIRQ
jgi:outer membrane receptor protein involved in Fe transport